MVVVPATMELLGHRNWWMPHWLDRVVPRLTIEGRAPAPAIGVSAAGGGA
jgi:RND superfamily putative drug exporter